MKVLHLEETTLLLTMQRTMCSIASVEQVMNERGMDFGTNIYCCKITELYRAEGMYLGMFKVFFSQKLY